MKHLQEKQYMNNRKKLIFPSILLVFSVLVFFVSVIFNKSYFEVLTNSNTCLYQIKQFVSILILFCIGYMFLKLIQTKLSSAWIFLLSFPSGICIWCFSCEAFLLFDFTLRPFRVAVLIAILFLLLSAIRFLLCRKSIIIPKQINISAIMIVLSVSLLVSTGFIYVVMNYDSYFYFSDYGKAIAKLMCYKDFVCNDSYVLTNIGQFLPLISTYATYFGLDTVFPYHIGMLINFLFMFGYSLWSTVPHDRRRKSIVYVSFWILLLLFCSPFFLFSNWVLSNTWIMFFLFPLVILWFQNRDSLSIDISIIMSLYSLTITMLRKDGLIIVCFIFLAYDLFPKDSLVKEDIRKRFTKSNKLLLMFMPSALYTVSYLHVLKYVLHPSVKTAVYNSLLIPKNQIILYLCILLTSVYLLIGSILVKKVIKKHLPLIITLLMAVCFIGYSCIRFPSSIDYLDAWLRNFVGIAFGYSIFLILFLIGISVICSEKYDFLQFVTLGYIILIFIIYEAKGNFETNIDNSGLRALIQILPVLFFTAAYKLNKVFFPLTNPENQEL